jgi:hypothetical protein
MEKLTGALTAIANNGFTWLNVVSAIMFLLGIRSLYKGLKSGKFRPPWFLSGDRLARPVFYWLAIALSIPITILFLLGALGFANSQINHLWP